MLRSKEPRCFQAEIVTDEAAFAEHHGDIGQANEVWRDFCRKERKNDMSLREFLLRYMMPKVEWKMVLRNALYLFLCLLVQTMLLSRFRIAGICPYALPAAAVALGMFEGPIGGVLYSLVLGYFADIPFIDRATFGEGLFSRILCKNRRLAKTRYIPQSQHIKK